MWLCSLALSAAVLQANPSATAEPPDGRIFELRTGAETSLDALADDLARRDVVFLGEDHDNPAGHRQQAAILAALHRRRPDLVLSLEMFERDVQGALDDYLRGRIDEAAFLKHSRPWRDYAAHYRPLVEFAREHKLDVLAANVPRQVARKTSLGQEHSQADRAWLPRQTTAPKDTYWERFAAEMKGHAGTDDPDAMDRYYASQCLKDDAMGEAISDYLARTPHRKPLVVHVCGKFHSDYGQGTVWRLLARRPLLHVGVVTMEALPAAGASKKEGAEEADSGKSAAGTSKAQAGEAGKNFANETAPFDPHRHAGKGHYLLAVPAAK